MGIVSVLKHEIEEEDSIDDNDNDDTAPEREVKHLSITQNDEGNNEIEVQQHQSSATSSTVTGSSDVTPKQREMERLVNALGNKYFTRKNESKTTERKVNMHQHSRKFIQTPTSERRSSQRQNQGTPNRDSTMSVSQLDFDTPGVGSGGSRQVLNQRRRRSGHFNVTSDSPRPTWERNPSTSL